MFTKVENEFSGLALTNRQGRPQKALIWFKGTKTKSKRTKGKKRTDKNMKKKVKEKRVNKIQTKV